MYNCQILADSLNPQGDRLITMKITFPRIVLAEFNTHRMFSRNSASSRAIPFWKMVKMVEENPFIPVAWQCDHKGMQGNKYITEPYDIEGAIETWLDARNNTVIEAKRLNSGNLVTKQLCNRLLEPFMWHTVLVTANESAFNHFFELRCPQYQANTKYYRSKKDAVKDNEGYEKVSDLEWLQSNDSQADIHIQVIAELMYDSVKKSKSKELKAGEWHTPFGDNINKDELYQAIKTCYPSGTYEYFKEPYEIRVCVARAARISYQTLGDNPKVNYEADIKLHDMLLESKHWSPFEHCARIMSEEEYSSYFQGRVFVNQNEPDYKEQNEYWAKNGSGWCRNFRGFIQYRHLVENLS